MSIEKIRRYRAWLEDQDEPIAGELAMLFLKYENSDEPKTTLDDVFVVSTKGSGSGKRESWRYLEALKERDRLFRELARLLDGQNEHGPGHQSLCKKIKSRLDEYSETKWKNDFCISSEPDSTNSVEVILFQLMKLNAKKTIGVFLGDRALSNIIRDIK